MKYIIVKMFKDKSKSWKQKVKRHLKLYMGTWVTEAINFSETNSDQKAVGRHMQSDKSIKKVVKNLKFSKTIFQK